MILLLPTQGLLYQTNDQQGTTTIAMVVCFLRRLYQTNDQQGTTTHHQTFDDDPLLYQTNDQQGTTTQYQYSVSRC